MKELTYPGQYSVDFPKTVTVIATKTTREKPESTANAQRNLRMPTKTLCCGMPVAYEVMVEAYGFSVCIVIVAT